MNRNSIPLQKAGVFSHSAKNTGQTESSPLSILLSFLSAIPLSLLFLTLVTAVAYSTDDPTALCRPCGYIACALTASIQGILLGKRGASPWRQGILGGLFLSLLLALLSLFFRDETGLTAPIRGALYLGVILLETLGALLASHRKKVRTIRARTARHRPHRRA